MRQIIAFETNSGQNEFFLFLEKTLMKIFNVPYPILYKSWLNAFILKVT